MFILLFMEFEEIKERKNKIHRQSQIYVCVLTYVYPYLCVCIDIYVLVWVHIAQISNTGKNIK